MYAKDLHKVIYYPVFPFHQAMVPPKSMAYPKQ